MFRRIRYSIAMLACMTVMCLGLSALADDPEISGVIGFDPVDTQSCIGVWLPLDDEESLEGVRWYNNDGTISFTHVYVSGGATDGPGLLSDAVSVADYVQGGSSAWSQLFFAEDYTCSAGGVYVFFQLPYGSVQVAEGEGGGAGIGYTSAEEGVAGWMTLEGEEWDSLHPDYGFAVDALVGVKDAGTVILEQVVKSVGVADKSAEEVVELQTAMLPPRPNPFNPKTTLKFTLKDAGKVNLSIYDLQGRLVKVLANQTYAAGEHELVWLGRNDSGREVASGLYLARIQANRYSQTHRLVLVR